MKALNKNSKKCLLPLSRERDPIDKRAKSFNRKSIGGKTEVRPLRGTNQKICKSSNL
jgi:hypothetical protein